jgi:hypothetical protein
MLGGVDEETPGPETGSRAWQAPQLTVLGTLGSVTKTGAMQVGDAGIGTGNLAGSSGSVSS